MKILIAVLLLATPLAAAPVQTENAAPAQPSLMSADTAAAIAAATRAAESWLRLVDEGRYDASWETAAKAFQEGVSKEDWEQTLAQVRLPLEPIGARTLRMTRYLENPPQAPPGVYVLVQFETQSAGGAVIETVVPMRSGDDWKVSGYFVQGG
jgi:hypothetical protein